MHSSNKKSLRDEGKTSLRYQEFFFPTQKVPELGLPIPVIPLNTTNRQSLDCKEKTAKNDEEQHQWDYETTRSGWKSGCVHGQLTSFRQQKVKEEETNNTD